MKRATVFLSFSICDSSVTDYFLALSIKLSEIYQVVVITDRLERVDIPKNIKVLKWPGIRGTTWKDFLFLKNQVSKFKPHMMIANFGAVNMFLIIGFLFQIPHRIAWVHTISSQFKFKKFKQFRKKWIYKLATQLYTNSKATKADVVSTFKVSEKKIKVVFNSVKEYKFKHQQMDCNKIVFVGRMHPSKGINTLIKALGIVNKQFPNVYLELLGGNLENQFLKEYQELAQALNIEDQVRFLGNQSKQQVLEIFSSAYFSVVPSLVEAFGYVVIESFSVKTPVIGSRTSGISEIIRDNKDGLLFDPQNETDLAEKMITLLKYRSLRDEFSVSCYERFKDDFEVTSVTHKLAKDLSVLIEEPLNL